MTTVYDRMLKWRKDKGDSSCGDDHADTDNVNVANGSASADGKRESSNVDCGPFTDAVRKKLRSAFAPASAFNDNDNFGDVVIVIDDIDDRDCGNAGEADSEISSKAGKGIVKATSTGKAIGKADIKNSGNEAARHRPTGQSRGKARETGSTSTSKAKDKTQGLYATESWQHCGLCDMTFTREKVKK